MFSNLAAANMMDRNGSMISFLPGVGPGIALGTAVQPRADLRGDGRHCAGGRPVKRRVARFWERTRSEPGLGRNLVAIGVLVALGTVFAGYFLVPPAVQPAVGGQVHGLRDLRGGRGDQPRQRPGGPDRRRARRRHPRRGRDRGRAGSARAAHRQRPRDPRATRRSCCARRARSTTCTSRSTPGTSDAPTLEDGDTLPCPQTVSPGPGRRGARPPRRQRPGGALDAARRVGRRAGQRTADAAARAWRPRASCSRSCDPVVDPARGAPRRTWPGW